MKMTLTDNTPQIETKTARARETNETATKTIPRAIIETLRRMEVEVGLMEAPLMVEETVTSTMEEAPPEAMAALVDARRIITVAQVAPPTVTVARVAPPTAITVSQEAPREVIMVTGLIETPPTETIKMEGRVIEEVVGTLGEAPRIVMVAPRTVIAVPQVAPQEAITVMGPTETPPTKIVEIETIRIETRVIGEVAEILVEAPQIVMVAPPTAITAPQEAIMVTGLIGTLSRKIAETETIKMEVRVIEEVAGTLVEVPRIVMVAPRTAITALQVVRLEEEVEIALTVETLPIETKAMTIQGIEETTARMIPRTGAETPLGMAVGMGPREAPPMVGTTAAETLVGDLLAEAMVPRVVHLEGEMKMIPIGGTLQIETILARETNETAATIDPPETIEALQGMVDPRGMMVEAARITHPMAEEVVTETRIGIPRTTTTIHQAEDRAEVAEAVRVVTLREMIGTEDLRVVAARPEIKVVVGQVEEEAVAVGVLAEALLTATVAHLVDLGEMIGTITLVEVEAAAAIMGGKVRVEMMTMMMMITTEGEGAIAVGEEMIEICEDLHQVTETEIRALARNRIVMISRAAREIVVTMTMMMTTTMTIEAATIAAARRKRRAAKAIATGHLREDLVVIKSRRKKRIRALVAIRKGEIRIRKNPAAKVEVTRRRKEAKINHHRVDPAVAVKAEAPKEAASDLQPFFKSESYRTDISSKDAFATDRLDAVSSVLADDLEAAYSYNKELDTVNFCSMPPLLVKCPCQGSRV